MQNYKTGYIYLLEVIEPTSKFFGFRYIGRHLSTNNKQYYGSGTIIKTLLKKHGSKCFKKTIIVNNIFNRFLLDELEIHYIRLYNTYMYESSYGLNLCRGGRGPVGNKMSIDVKIKISNTLKNRTFTQEHKNKISKSNIGKVMSKESINKRRFKIIGTKRSIESRIKQGLTIKGEKHFNYGKPSFMKNKNHSEETKKLMSLSAIGKNLGKKHTKEHIDKRKLKQLKSIYQYDKENRFIKEWNSATTIENMLSINKKHISRCAYGDRPSAGGFKWSFTKL